MDRITHPRLQNRWRIHRPQPGLDSPPFLLYYGLRNYPLHKEQNIPVSNLAASILIRMDGKTGWSELDIPSSEEVLIRKLVDLRVIVDASDFKPLKTISSRQTCVCCINDDYVIPGLEFNEDGLCAFCQCYARETAAGSHMVPTITEEELQSWGSRHPTAAYDAMVLYTGGKDSSFLLWYLARRLGLRIMAAFWDMPYTSPAARDNIKRAKEHLPEVDFVEWTLGWKQIQQAMRGQLIDFGAPCLCPTAAFALFYPLAFNKKIPVILFGMEDVQTAVVDYIFQRPPSPEAGTPTGRELTLHFLRLRALPRSLVQPVKWEQDLANYHASINHQLGTLFDECRQIISRAETDSAVEIPLIKRLSTAGAYGNWQNVVDILQSELGWEMPEEQTSKLHTSCRIEPVKDFCQFQRFRHMRTVFYPQSMVELSASVFFGMTDRQQALGSLNDLGYYKTPAVFHELLADLEIDPDSVTEADGELYYIVGDACLPPDDRDKRS